MFNDVYPINDFGPLMKGLAIGGLGIFHVFLAQFAIGGGFLMSYLQWLDMRNKSTVARAFLDSYFKFLVLVSFVMGAVTGVAMWFTSIQVSPRTIGLMVSSFHWVWATEWTFFSLEVVSGYAFYRYGKHLKDRARLTLLILYTVAAWFSLFWINGILSWQLIPMVLMPFLGAWYIASMPADSRAWATGGSVAMTMFFTICVAFVAYSWTENHLLSVNSPEQWRAFYAEGKEIYFEPQIIPRLAVWGLGSIATACVWLAWQFRYRAVHHLPVDSQSISRLPKVALFGLVASILCGIGYYFSAPHLGAVFLGPMARWYLAAAILGMIAQLTGWFQLLRQIPSTNGISLKPLLLTTAGLVATVLGMSVCREAIRLSSLGATRLQELIPQHAEAMKVEGFWVFLLFAVINSAMLSGDISKEFHDLPTPMAIDAAVGSSASKTLG